MRLLKNIYQVAGCMYGVHQNVYAVDAGTEVVLIDSGKDAADYEVIQRNLKYWKLDKKPVTKLLLTHAHCEHSGNAADFESAGVTIIGHPLCAEAVKTGNDRTAAYAFMDFTQYKVCRKVRSVEEGDVITAGNLYFTVFHVPGHSDDSVIYQLNTDDMTVLFPGDTVLHDKLCQESRLGWTGAVDYNQELYVKSLMRLSEMQADVVLPGHGEACLTEGSRMLVGAFLRARLLLTTQPVTTVLSENMFR